jgi:Na+-transporting NADH:ubiquinone oxidoreductase subunit C
MRKSDTYTLLFALAVCAVCSVILAVAASSLRERQELNVELYRKINVLKAFGKVVEKQEVQTVFDKHITEMECATALGIDGKMPLYLWKKDGTTTMCALPVSGKGLWSTIRGYLALKSDMNTIQGITFYDHGETPGLGGEIEKEWFQDQFQGKKILEAGKLTGLEIVKGKVADRYPDGNSHAVDGISGATRTSKGVERFLNSDLKRYNEYFKTQRGTK